MVRTPEEALRDATDWLRQQRDYRGEIYVFTDLASEAWPDDLLASTAKRLDELPGTNVYVVDVGAERPQNLGIAPLRLSTQQLGPGGLLQIDANLLHAGEAGAQTSDGAKEGADEGGTETTVELYLTSKNGGAEKRGQQVVSPTAEGPSPVEFSLSGLELGTHQGYLRIVGSDPLPCDDVRYFTVDVRPPSHILLLGQAGTDTVFLREALAPSAASGAVPPKFVCEERGFDQLTSADLAKFDAICLADPPPLPAAAWQALARYVEGGGGLGVFLGRRAGRDEMNASAPQQLLPAELKWVSRDATYLRPVAVEHPALADLRGLVDIAPWSEFPVFQYWELEPGAGGRVCRRELCEWEAGACGAACGPGTRLDDDDERFRSGLRRSMESARDWARAVAVFGAHEQHR